MSRKGRIRLISFAVAIVVVLSSAIVVCHVGAGTYTARLDAQSTRAFGEASSAVDRMRRSLEACAYASDAPMQSSLFTHLFADAEAARTALNALPVELDALENLSRQISVAGDYACLLSRMSSDGHLISPDALSQLTDFSKMMRSLSESLSEIRLAYEQRDLRMEFRGRLLDSLDNLESEAETASDTINAVFHDLAASLPEARPLVYDGQFSDHTGDQPRMLQGKLIVTQAEAADAAAAFLRCNRSDLLPLDFRSGDLACWRFSFPKEHAVIAVTARGAEILEYLSDCLESGDDDPDQAETLAKAFLAEHGYSDMQLVERKPGGSENIMIFAPLSDGVLCLPDRITLRVCSGTGKVTAFNASDYLRHHTKRAFPETNGSWVPPEPLSVDSQRKVVLLSPGGQDHFCVEYLCSAPQGERVRIFVNAVSGMQEQILLGAAGSASVD